MGDTLLISCRKWVHYSCTQLPTYMIYQLAVILTNVDYKCEFCILSPGQVVSDKFMEIDLAISTQKSLGNGGLLDDSDTTVNDVDQPPPANDAPITNGETGPPLEINVDQQGANPAPPSCCSDHPTAECSPANNYSPTWGVCPTWLS